MKTLAITAAIIAALTAPTMLLAADSGTKAAMGDQTDTQAYHDAVKALLQMETFAIYGGG